MYFQQESFAARYGTNSWPAVETLAIKFMTENPLAPYPLVLDFPAMRLSDNDGAYTVDLTHFYPELAIGEVVGSFAKTWSKEERDTNWQIQCVGPSSLWLNGAKVWQSTPEKENNRIFSQFSLHLTAGWNQVVVVSEKTNLGQGFALKNAMPQWEPTFFYTLGKEQGAFRKIGFTYQKLNLEQQLCPVLQDKLPTYPQRKRQEIIANRPRYYLVALPEKSFLSGNVEHFSYWNKKSWQPCSTDIAVDFLLYYGANLTADLSACLTETAEWVYQGPFALQPTATQHLAGEKLWQGCYENSYGRYTQLPSEFARWTYPLGVTLTGFWQASQTFAWAQLAEYVIAFAEQVVAYDAYCLKEQEIFTYATLNTQLYWLTELDDCGSFGNFLLQVQPALKNQQGLRRLLQRIAEFIYLRQERNPDGTFVRGNQTMWIDDLYMSCPFLTHYYQFTHEEKYLLCAGKQFLGFKERMFLPQQNLMSHIFETNYAKANLIPWSRGNGWVIYSLSELLVVLPAQHELRIPLQTFYRELVKGLLSLQDDSGLWHQILDEPATYAETSATAMFICAFAKGILRDWLPDTMKNAVLLACQQGWQGIVTEALDEKGNLYGVCQGSGFSFARSYYRQLGWRLNDYHGIGITVQAGTAWQQLQESLKE
ncbi:glycoside hydrolase family 88/105 protein [Enterococcus nangangensis]|uniref:glycoside hydrolase family 88/105 protein n=1 Tax=Enterococcus nangangensis TaxID=2559926 RepID=UPI0010F66F8A|nr:glycoside hydrolase family 88 protein [Enterococcus nangangensis]